MVYQSLKKLLSKYPWFFDKSETSNFFRSQYVTNRQFQELYQSLFTVIQSFKLNKRCLIWKDQTEPYDYIINFVANFPNMKSVSCYKNDALIYSEHYTYEENVSSFIYFYDSSDETISMEDVFEETEDTIDITDESEEVPIIPTDTFKIIVETYDEYIITKGFPENDTPQGNEFDHDYSLDRIGQIDGIPRKQYIETVDYANTEPPFNDRLTEDDYHYMNRILNYNLRFHNTPRPVLEIWKLYGIFSDMINREQYLFKMFDENHHLNKETGLYDPDWTPQQWEHKDRLCELTPNLGQFFFVSANTLLPVQNQSVRFEFKYINSLAEELTGNYNVSIFLNDDDEALVDNFTGSQYVVNSELLLDDVPNNFVFIAYEGETEFAREELNVTVRGCTTADWYVSPNGDDTNDGKTNQTPFQNISKALSSVNGEENLIVLMSGIHTINQILSVPFSCTILGCGSPVVNNTDGLKFFNVLQNKELTLQNLTLKYESNQSMVSNVSYQNNNANHNGLYVMIPEGVKIGTSLNILTDKLSYVVGESVDISGSLVDEDSVGLSGKTVKIYVNNTLVDSVTTLNTGSFSKTVTALEDGDMVIRAVFEGDEDYYSTVNSVTVSVIPKPVPDSITLVAENPIMSKGENNKITATVLDSDGNPCVGETVSFSVVDGEDLGTAVTDSAGEAFVYYLGKGTNLLNIKCILGGLSDEIQIQDYEYYNPGNSVSTLQIGTGVQCTSNGDYITITTSTTDEKYVELPVVLPSDFEFSVEVAELGAVNYYAWEINKGQTYGYGSSGQGANLGNRTQSISNSVIKGSILIIKCQNGTTTVSCDGNTINSRNITFTGKTIGFYTNSGRVQHLKNIILKSL